MPNTGYTPESSVQDHRNLQAITKIGKFIPAENFVLNIIISAGLCLQSCVGGVCSALIAKEEQLNELDRGSGDGDCGSTLKAGVAGIYHMQRRENRDH